MTPEELRALRLQLLHLAAAAQSSAALVPSLARAYERYVVDGVDVWCDEPEAPRTADKQAA